MKTSDKLIEAYDKFRPHISGHRSAMNLFIEALKEVEEMENELSKLHQSTVSDVSCSLYGNKKVCTEYKAENGKSCINCKWRKQTDL